MWCDTIIVICWSATKVLNNYAQSTLDWSHIYASVNSLLIMYSAIRLNAILQTNFELQRKRFKIIFNNSYLKDNADNKAFLFKQIAPKKIVSSVANNVFQVKC